MLIVTTPLPNLKLSRNSFGEKLLFANKVVPVHVLYIYAEVSDEHSKSVKHGFMSNFSNNYIYIYRTCNSVL